MLEWIIVVGYVPIGYLAVYLSGRFRIVRPFYGGDEDAPGNVFLCLFWPLALPIAAGVKLHALGVWQRAQAERRTEKRRDEREQQERVDAKNARLAEFEVGKPRCRCYGGKEVCPPQDTPFR
mgnify:CR=1 FL=1